MSRRKRGAASRPATGSSGGAASPAPRSGSRRRAPRLIAGALAAAALAGLGYLAWPRHARRNVLFVTIDTLRADRVGAWGHAGAATPALDALAARGVRFANAQAPVPLTGPSHATIFTGSYPPVHGVRDNVAFTLGERHETLAERLKREGYRTAAFVAAYPVAAGFGFAQGFDEYSESFHEIPIPGQGAERPANEVADEVIAWLQRSASGPFFAWAHLYDPHAPYTPPSPYRERFAGRLYDGEVAFADAQLGRILETLRALGRERDTLVVALADHGESLGEHDEQTHAVLIYEATLHIPLILAGPGVPEGRVVEERVGAVDVLPTLLALLGAGTPKGLPGRDLRPSFESQGLPAEPLYSESLFARLNCRWSSLRGLTLEDWKLIRGAGSELYNLSEDPGETRDRASEEPERVARLETLLALALAKMAPGGDVARPVALSPEQEERLRSLGYTSGTGGGGDLDQRGLPDPRRRVYLYERVQALSQARGTSVDAAIAELISITDDDPGNPYAHFALANKAYRHGQLALAESAYARTMELDPERPGMRVSYGKLLLDLGRLEEAERQLRIAVEQTTPQDVRTRAMLADALIRLGKQEEATRLVDAALAAEPNHVDVLRSKGRLLVASDRAAEGLPLLERAAAGSDPEPWIEIAQVHVALGEPAAALSAAEQALSRNPGHPWALAVRGQALILAGRKDEGLESLRRSLSAGPRRPEVWLTLAAGFDSAGDRPAATRCRERARLPIARSG